jgi:hypothetical protein
VQCKRSAKFCHREQRNQQFSRVTCNEQTTDPRLLKLTARTKPCFRRLKAEPKTTELENRLLDLKTVTGRGTSSRIRRSHHQVNTGNFVANMAFDWGFEIQKTLGIKW